MTKQTKRPDGANTTSLPSRRAFFSTVAAAAPVVAIPAEPNAVNSHGGYTDAEIMEMGRKLAYDYLESSGWFDRQRSGMEAPK